MAIADGQVLTAADFARYSDAAWTAFTPGVTAASGSLGALTASCRWQRIGRIVIANFVVTLSATGAGTASGALRVALPVVAAAADRSHSVGRVTPNLCAVYQDGTASYVSVVSATGATVIANNADIRFQIVYEAAS